MRRRNVLIGIAAIVMAASTIPALADTVEVHGLMQARFALANDDYGFRMDRFSLRLQQKVDDEFNWLTEVYFHPTSASATGRVYLESAYLNWNLKERLPWDFSLRIGKGRNEAFAQAPYYSRRRTSDYSLFSEVYTQSRVEGVQTFSTFGNMQLALAVLNPLIPAAGRSVPDMPTGSSITIPCGDGENADNTTDRVALSGRLGYKGNTPIFGAFNAGVSAYMTETTAAGDNEMNRFAVDGEFKTAQGFLVQGQALVGSTNGTDQNGAEILGGWENAEYGLYARYGAVSYDDATMADLDQIMVSALYKIRPTIHLRVEGLINGEDKTAKVDNDVLFFETLFAW